MPQITLPPARDSLVQALIAGREGAFDQFVEQFATPVLLLAYRLTGDLESARDIRQVALWRTYRSVSRFQGRSQLSTWLYRIVVNLARDWARSQASIRAGTNADSENAPVISAAQPADPIERDERQRLIRKAMLTLCDTDREVIALRHMREMTFREMAGILDRPETTVKSQCARAKDRLHTALVRQGLINTNERFCSDSSTARKEGQR